MTTATKRKNSVNKIINDFTGRKKIPKHEFDSLKLVIENVPNFTIKKHLNILLWFDYLHKIETIGWRPNNLTRKITKLLQDSEKYPINFYSLFCPSYKKGIGMHGFRTDAVGDTTIWGVKMLLEIERFTNFLGFKTTKPEAIFFDLAVEQPEKSLAELDDLEANIVNFKKQIPNSIAFKKLSQVYPVLADVVGYQGVKLNPLPIPNKIFLRIIERGQKFYQLFGWSEAQILERSRVIASSEGLVGYILRDSKPNGIMVYTPTMLERASIYSGRRQNDPLPIIFPKHDE